MSGHVTPGMLVGFSAETRARLIAANNPDLVAVVRLNNRVAEQLTPEQNAAGRTAARALGCSKMLDQVLSDPAGDHRVKIAELRTLLLFAAALLGLEVGR